MNFLNRNIFTHKKVLIVFLLAIFLPSLIVGYLSLSTFSQRREAIKNILESNVRFSAEALLRSFEEKLYEYEDNALQSDNFLKILKAQGKNQTFIEYNKILKNIAGQLFLLDSNYEILFPNTGNKDQYLSQYDRRRVNSKFNNSFQRAETFEFTENNYTQAAEFYEKSFKNTSSQQYQAMALEGLGRCLLADNKYGQAYKVYEKLSTNYSFTLNKANHPYGIAARFRLYEISKRKKENKQEKILIDLYEQIKEGFWPINSFAFDFFISEIESEITELKKSYMEIKQKKSPYKGALNLTDLLNIEAISKIKAKQSIVQNSQEIIPERLFLNQNNEFFLISYKIFKNLQSNKTYLGGLFWDLNYHKNHIIPEIFEELTENSGHRLQLIDIKNVTKCVWFDRFGKW